MMKIFQTTPICIIIFILALSRSRALVQSTSAATNSKFEQLVEVERLMSAIANGRVYQQENFLTEDQVQIMINDIERLREQNMMKPSGLSNTLKKSDQKFGDEDRKC